MNSHGGRGAILADEMGLGKTLTTISLIWCLLRQYQPIKRAIIVTPASLCKNWNQEFAKWLGDARIKPILMSEKANKKYSKKAVARDFVQSSANVHSVLIISYEQYRMVHAELNKIRNAMLVCDEGHRLKSSAGNKTIRALKAFPGNRRLVVTGTPVQNDLKEFFAMVDFVNPGSLGDLKMFINIYAKAIDAGRDRGATPRDKLLSTSRAGEINNTTECFILRRTTKVLDLPPRVEQAVFCRMTPLQIGLYQHELASTTALKLRSSGGCPLQLISILKKISNHPDIAEEVNLNDDTEISHGLLTALQSYRRGTAQVHQSGKLNVTAKILRQVISCTRDKIVLVSNFTKTLDVLEKLCTRAGYAFYRLDGSTEQSKRQDMVVSFKQKSSPQRIFLLSSKAGGVGLNLIGANRLLIFDPDWNPAVDDQVMARVWRMGQRKPVFIYRLLSTGSIDEKIYQRQISKREIAKVVVDQKKKTKRHFTPDDLRGLFTLNLTTTSDTADLMKDFSQDWGMQVEIQDAVLKEIAATDLISYVHVTPAQKNTERETPAPAATPCSLLPSQEHAKQEQVFSSRNYEQELVERPEDALELEDDPDEHAGETLCFD